MKWTRHSHCRASVRGGLSSLFLLALAACEQQPVAPPKDFVGSLGTLVIDGNQNDEFRFIPGEPPLGELATGPSDQSGFAEILKVTTSQLPAGLFDLRLEAPTQQAIQRNQPCWLHFLARTQTPQADSAEARIGVAVRLAEGRRRDLRSEAIYVPASWTPIDLAFKVPVDLPAGAASVVFGLGSQPQAVELAGPSLRCFDPEVALERLPATRFSYTGRALDAPWRAAAEQRIDTLRRGDLHVEVVDQAGQPVAGADVQVQLKRHSFGFGNLIDAELLAGQGPGGGPSQYSGEETARYRQLLGELFNLVAFDNGMSWSAWADPTQRRVTEDALAWVDSLDLRLHGHSLVSPRWRDLPADVQLLKGEVEVLRNALRLRVKEMVSDFGGRVAAWQVVDQPRERHELLDVLGADEMDEWFKIARATAAEPRLMVNETEVLEGDQLASLVQLVEGLRARQVPIDSIGLELHVASAPPPLELIEARLDRLGQLGLPVFITALDIDTTDDALQADYLRDLLTLFFSSPVVEGVLLEGFWAGRAQRPAAALYGQDWTIKPSAEAYRKLVFEQWRTDQLATTDASGVVTITGYVGDYQISARRGEQNASQAISLPAQGASVTLRLPGE